MLLDGRVAASNELFLAGLEQQQQELCPAGCGQNTFVPVVRPDARQLHSCYASCRNMTIRDYLSSVYPTASSRFAQLEDVELFKFFRSLHFYYDHGCSFDGTHCSHHPGVLLRWLYDDLLPCKDEASQNCIVAHSRFSSSWMEDFDVSTSWLEVEHRSGGVRNIDVRDSASAVLKHGGGRGEDGHAASSFLDTGLAGMWYVYRRGSGIFYQIGRAKRAVGRTAMLADLLLEVAASRSLSGSWPIIAARLNFNTSLSAFKDSRLLRELSTGRRSCHSMGIRACRCGNTLPDSWDDALVWAARGLGYDSLLFSATLLCPRQTASGIVSAFPEIVDVRPLRRTWQREQEAGSFSMLEDTDAGTDNVHLRRKKHDVALEWVGHMREQKVLSLRDPGRLDDETAALPCEFNTSTMTLACDGHISSQWQQSEWSQCGFATLMCGQRSPWAHTNTQALSPPSPLLPRSLVPPSAPKSTVPGSMPSSIPPSSSMFASLLSSLGLKDTTHDTAPSSSPIDNQPNVQQKEHQAQIYRFVFTGLRHSGTQVRDGLQLSEIKLYSQAGILVRVPVALNPGGSRPNRLQGAPAAFDGSLSTKWFDSSIISAGSSKLLVQLEAGAERIASYEFYTGNDNPKRDPSDWTVQMRDEDSNTWRLIDRAEGVMPPDERRAAYERRPVFHTDQAGGPTSIYLLAAKEEKSGASEVGEV